MYADYSQFFFLITRNTIYFLFKKFKLQNNLKITHDFDEYNRLKINFKQY